VAATASVTIASRKPPVVTPPAPPAPRKEAFDSRK
jgi:hypothetical protein